MKVLLLSTSDINGGAPRAAYRLYQGLKNCEIDSKMLVQSKFSNEASIIEVGGKITQKISRIRPYLDALPKLAFRYSDTRKRTPYSLQWLPDSIANLALKLEPDIINLHFINGGFIKIETLPKFNKPLIWTLHDMWAFTGGCHYNQECQLYKESCSNCPQMPKRYGLDLSYWVWLRKAKAWEALNPIIVTPSRWLAKCAASSYLFRDKRIEVIPYGLDTQVYKPWKQSLVREKLRLPQDKFLILFGATKATSDPRKGFNLLKSTLEELSKSSWRDKCEIVIFGGSTSDDELDLGFKAHYLGNLNDEHTLAQVYAAADVFVAPSLQDNLPSTVMESLACGTPCVAFQIGGMSDMIEHRYNGYLARPFDVTDLAKGIAWILEVKNKLRYHAREKVEQEFTLEIQARRYLSLFAEFINTTN